MATIIGLNGTHTRTRNSHSTLLLEEAAKRLQETGHTMYIIKLADYHFNPCDHCSQCEINGECKHCASQDDQFKEILIKAQKADGFIIASPVYGLSQTSLMKKFILRFLPIINIGSKNPFRGKPLLNIAVSAGLGNASALMDIEYHQKELGFINAGSLGIGLLDADSELKEADTTGSILPTESDGIKGMIIAMVDKFVQQLSLISSELSLNNVKAY